MDLRAHPATLEEWDSLVIRVTRDLLDHKDHRDVLVRPELRDSVAGLDRTVCQEFQVRSAIPELQDMPVRMASVVSRVPKVKQAILGHGDHLDQLDLRDLEAIQEPLALLLSLIHI